jgi:hypothetical protein
MHPAAVVVVIVLGRLLLDVEEPTIGIENVLKIIIAIFSLLLLALSVSAYKKTGFKKILYAIAAFALFGIQSLFDFLADHVSLFDTEYNDIILLGMTIAILVLFFVAVVKRN